MRISLARRALCSHRRRPLLTREDRVLPLPQGRAGPRSHRGTPRLARGVPLRARRGGRPDRGGLTSAFRSDFSRLPAEVEYEYTMSSTGGTLDSAKIRCPRGHWFNGPIDALTLDTSQDEGRGQTRDEDQVGDGDASAA